MMIQPQGQAPALPPSRFDIPIIRNRGLVPGRGPRVEYQFQEGKRGTFLEEAANNREADQTLMKEVSRILHTHYRGHFWAVMVDSHQGVCQITIPILLGNWGWTILLTELTPWLVIKAGGDILERFNIPRSGLDVARFVEAREHRVSRASQKPPGGL